MKKLLFVFLLFWLFVSVVYWNSYTGDNICQEIQSQFNILWPDIVVVNYPVHYQLNNVDNIHWKILKNNKSVFSLDWKILNYEFKTTWKVILQAEFNYNNCDIVISKKINIYKFIILNITDKKEYLPIDFNNKNIYITTLNWIEFPENKYIIKLSDYIIINEPFVINFFSNLDKTINRENKKFILLIWNLKGFFLRFIIPYVKNIYNNNIYIYNKQYLLNILSDIYQWKQIDKKNLLSTSIASDKIYLPISYFTNKLIEAGLNINIIWITFISLFGILVVAFFRQIIWFSVFWVYTPLISALLIIIFWYKLLLLLFVLSIITNILTYLITRYFYILYSAKISLNYIIYVMLSIITIWILVNFSIISKIDINLSIVVLFFIMPLLTKNFIKEDTKILSKTFLLFMWEFVFITWLLLIILQINLLKYILIAYPDLLVVLWVLTILIGRFTWLQLLEYIRFYPLIKKSLHEE